MSELFKKDESILSKEVEASIKDCAQKLAQPIIDVVKASAKEYDALQSKYSALLKIAEGIKEASLEYIKAAEDYEENGEISVEFYLKLKNAIKNLDKFKAESSSMKDGVR